MKDCPIIDDDAMAGPSVKRKLCIEHEKCLHSDSDLVLILRAFNSKMLMTKKELCERTKLSSKVVDAIISSICKKSVVNSHKYQLDTDKLRRNGGEKVNHETIKPILKEAFKRQSQWTTDGLIMILSRLEILPENKKAWLMQLLLEFCFYTSINNIWQLRPQFQKDWFTIHTERNESLNEKKSLKESFLNAFQVKPNYSTAELLKFIGRTNKNDLMPLLNQYCTLKVSKCQWEMK